MSLLGTALKKASQPCLQGPPLFHVLDSQVCDRIKHTVRRHFVPRHFVPGHILSRDNMSPGQYVALCPHYFAVQRGDILSQETYCPGSVRRHIVPGDVLSRLATNGNFGQQMHEGLLWLLWLLLLHTRSLGALRAPTSR